MLFISLVRSVILLLSLVLGLLWLLASLDSRSTIQLIYVMNRALIAFVDLRTICLNHERLGAVIMHLASSLLVVLVELTILDEVAQLNRQVEDLCHLSEDHDALVQPNFNK